MEITADQERAIHILARADATGPVVICGYAGTGKSWLASTLVPEIFRGKRLIYAAPSNKVVRKILRGRLRDAGHQVSDFPPGRERRKEGFTDQIYAGTVFSLLNLPKWELVCAVTGKPCKEGQQCAEHRSLAALDLKGRGNPPEPCLVRQSDLASDPRDDPLAGAEVIIIDEASMLGYDDYQTLCSQCAQHRIPLILFGDPGQLPPIPKKGEPRDFSALTRPVIVMDDIVRQKKDDPITHLARFVRDGQYLTPWSWGPSAHVLPFDLGQGILAASNYFAQRAAAGDMIICARHDGSRPGGRVWHNMRAREALGFSGEQPVPGDVVVAMDTDYYLKRAWNSDRGVVLEASAPFRWPDTATGQVVIEMLVKFSEHRDPRRLLTLAKRFNYPANKTEDDWKIPASLPLRPALRSDLSASRPQDLTWQERKMLDDRKEPLIRLDYGYALTAWKAQGDEARGVLVTGAFDKLPHVDRRKYLYTAITRAREEVAIG